MNYQNIEFLTSAETPVQCPPDIGREVAFAGRSNAGKSSAINSLTGHKKLARTSKTPGRTQLMNFFVLDDEVGRIVDLPGYGYAKVSKAVQARWQENLDLYLRSRASLMAIVLIMDIRHPLKPFDLAMLDWSSSAGKDILILLTKADKLSRNAAQQTAAKVRATLKQRNVSATIVPFSSTESTGQNEAWAFLDTIFDVPAPTEL
ncbi:ribosome biogenesis GTP-binding protein YihA/YsxC [Allohahella marinimesophila]|uniref:Probable GTP-binding protein EngB n=1 Tax=Allohahella marinimesophila TaxID=1054972 RepID=A0ABP7PUX7_9GAMM